MATTKFPQKSRASLPTVKKVDRSSALTGPSPRTLKGGNTVCDRRPWCTCFREMVPTQISALPLCHLANNPNYFKKHQHCAYSVISILIWEEHTIKRLPFPNARCTWKIYLPTCKKQHLNKGVLLDLVSFKNKQISPLLFEYNFYFKIEITFSYQKK